MLSNALDFVHKAIDEIRDNLGEQESENKYAALYLAAGIEILVKARLASEHWSLVFDDPRSASRAKFESGDFKSVAAGEVISRFNNVASQNVDTAAAKQVFDLRNRLVHLAPSPNGFASRVVLARGLDFVTNFLHRQLQPHLQLADARLAESAQKKILVAYSELQDFADKRMANLAKVLASEPVVVDCHRCSKRAMVIHGSHQDPACLFCFHSEPPMEAADSYATLVLGWSSFESVKQGGHDPVSECPNCGEPALVSGIAVARRAKVHYACFACAEVYATDDLTPCDRCGSLIDAGPGRSSVCAACWSALGLR